MKQTALPPAFSTYRTRERTVNALDCGDGRHVILEPESPRYVPTAEFLQYFELVPEKRLEERRHSNGRGRPKGKKERRKGAGRRETNGDTPRAKARELWDEGKDPPAIAKAIGKNVANVYYWKKVDKWPAQKAAAAKPKAAPAAAKEEGEEVRCRHCSRMTPANGKWCIHCMQDP
jgi:hypothetical protein